MSLVSFASGFSRYTTQKISTPTVGYSISQGVWDSTGTGRPAIALAVGFLVLNATYVRGHSGKDWLSLYLRRKRLEEQQRIQQLENPKE